MDSNKFIKKCKQIVEDYVYKNSDRSHIEPGDFEPRMEVYVVWSTKVLKNNKALLSTDLPDGMYYELTFNGEKNEIYFDAYKKWENKVITI